MCGIIGIFGNEAIEQHDRESVESGARAMALRGPDGEGFHEGPGYYFGHRRLAILDPRSGHQPWVDQATGVVLTYNGEIYNFGELRARLQSRGHRFLSSCDTELLVRAYVEWGRDCLSRFTGMFAFALLDPREDAIWLVRDRLGVKPLYYQFSGQLRFASSIKALFAFPEIDRVMDRSALWHYLRTIRTSLEKQSLIRDVFTLEPGQALWWRRSKSAPEIKNYWKLPAHSQKGMQLCDFDTAVEETRARVDAAVRSQLISDVPLGGFLSGGLDSSVMTSAAITGGSNQFGTYSVGYEENGFNEWTFVREAAEYYGVSNEEIHLSGDDYLKDWEWLISEKGLPLSTPNEVPIWHLAKSFRSRFTAALTGEGADEVFGGYVGPAFCATDYDRANGRLGPVEEDALIRGYGTNRFESRCHHFFHVNSWLTRNRLADLIEPSFLPAAPHDPVTEYYGRLFRETETRTTFDAYLRVHLRVNLEGLLGRLDSSTMAASVEGRVPFTDHSLVEYLFSLPDTFKMSLARGTAWRDVRSKNSFEIAGARLVESKRLLRSAYRDRVCGSILRRDKMSFPVPFGDWFQTILADPYRAHLGESAGLATLFPAPIRLALQSSSEPDPMVAWPLMNLAIWQREFGLRL